MFKKSISTRNLYFSFLFLLVSQLFYYVKEFEIGYYLSKAVLPLVGMLIAIYFGLFFRIAKKSARAGGGVFAFAVYFFVSGALASIIFYEQDFVSSLTSQAKILPFFYFFVVLFVLAKYKATSVDIYIGLFTSGFLLTLLYIAAGFLINPAEFWTVDSSIFVNDAKGFRIRFPSALCVILYFICIHRLRSGFNASLCFVASIVLYFLVFELKQRVELLAIILATVAIYTDRRTLLLAFVVALIGILTFYLYWFADTQVDEYLSILSNDTSWLARARQLDYVFEVIRDQPFSIFFGVGKLSEIGDFGYEAYLGYKFTTADLGWVGVLHEYGIVGVSLVLLLIWIIYQETNVASKSKNYYCSLVAMAMRSYIVMSVFLSVIAPRFLYLSGLFFSIYAISVYINSLSESRVKYAK